MGSLSEYFEPFNSNGKYLFRIRSLAPLPSLDSSNTTPLSLSISSTDKVAFPAQSSKMVNPLSTFNESSVGIGSIYTVSSKPVYAFKSAPNCTPIYCK